MKKILIAVTTLLLVSCSGKVEKEESKYRYDVRTTHDNNWTTSGKYSCDSLQFINGTTAVLFIDGRQMKIYAPIIKVYDKN